MFTSEVVLRDGFGPAPAFNTLLAESDGEIVGYATWLPGYDSDLAARSMWLSDLFVVERARGRGIGRALLAAVAAETVRRGLACLEWGVMPDNASAREFYRRIGARASATCGSSRSTAPPSPGSGARGRAPSRRDPRDRDVDRRGPRPHLQVT